MPKRARSGSIIKKRYKGQAFRRSAKMRKRSRRMHIRGFKQLKMKARWSGTTWPRMLFKKFEYENTQEVDTGLANVSYNYPYNVASLYDPDGTTQPNPSVIDFSTFLTSAGPYRRYRVLGCKIKARFVNYGGTMAQVQCVIQRKGGTNEETVTVVGLGQEGFDNLSSLPGGSEPLCIGPITGGNNIKTKSWYVCPWLAMGVTKADYMSDDNYVGTYATNPTIFPRFDFVFLGLPDQATLQMRVKMTFYVQLLDPFQTVNHNAVTADPA